MSNEYRTSAEVVAKAKEIVRRTLRDIVPSDKIGEVEEKLLRYGSNRKGYLGDLVQEFLYGKKPDQRPEADFPIAGVELKTTPLKQLQKGHLVAKERLVFSMIDYDMVAKESWDKSSFLKKNKLTLLLFYLFRQGESLLDHKFVAEYLMDILNGLTPQERVQIRKDWEHIVSKIRNKQAHLLSEADTMYLAASTKGKNSSDMRESVDTGVVAKRRAFSLKKGFMDRLIAREVEHKMDKDEASAIDDKEAMTVEEGIRRRLEKHIGKTDKGLARMYEMGTISKSKRPNLIVRILTGKKVKRVEEFEKANVRLKVLTLEKTGSLKESVSFPKFDFRELLDEPSWYVETEDDTVSSELYDLLDQTKFLIVVFQKQGNSDEAVLRGSFFWNFPAADIGKAEEVWNETRRVLKSGEIISKIVKEKDGKSKVYNNFPGQRFNGVVHVRPHAGNKKDASPLPVPDAKTNRKEFTKQGFWINSTYMKKVIHENIKGL